MRITTLVTVDALIGEGPVWDHRNGSILWVDIPLGHLHTTNLATGAMTTLTVPTSLGAAVPRRHAPGYVAAIGEGFGTVAPDGTLDVTNRILPADTRMNDAKCDAAGRLWAGSCARDFTVGAGALHVLDRDLSTRVVLDGLTLPNGLGWSPAGDTFYLVDSLAHSVSAWDFDPIAGRLTGHRVLATFDDDEGLPDGLCIDTEGRLWIAMWGGRQIIVLSPAGDRLTPVHLPVAQPSSCAFVGADRDVLIVTSARDGLDPVEPIDGSLLAVHETGARGVPVSFFGG